MDGPGGLTVAGDLAIGADMASGRDTEIARAGPIGAAQFADTRAAGSAATSAVDSTEAEASMVEVSTVARTVKSLLLT